MHVLESLVPNAMVVGALALATALTTMSAGAQTQPSGSEPENGEVAGETEAAASATAEPSPEDVKRAGSHFERGLQLYNDAEYRLALIEFERAYQIVPNYRVKYNIAQVSIQIGRYAHALHALEAYLEEGGDNISEERRNSVKSDLTMLAGRTARVLITSNIEGAEILIDDNVIAKTPLQDKLLLDAGEHRLTVRQQGYQPKTERLTLAGGDDIELGFELSEVKKVKPLVVVKEVPKDRPSAPTQPKPEPFPYATVGWIATGGLAVGAVVTGIVGLSAKDKLDDLALPDPEQDPEQVKRDRDDYQKRARTWFLASDILKGAAVAAGAVSLYFTLAGDDAADPVQDAPARSNAQPKGYSVKAGATLNQVWLEGRF